MSKKENAYNARMLAAQEQCRELTGPSRRQSAAEHYHRARQEAIASEVGLQRRMSEVAAFHKVNESLFRNVDSFTPDFGSPHMEEQEDKPTTPTPPEALAEFMRAAKAGSWDQVVGQDEALGELKDAIEGAMTNPELYAHYNRSVPKGAALYGPPGCGKTMFAKAVAGKLAELAKEDEVPYLFVTAGSVQSKFVGETEKTINALFKFAREYKQFAGVPLLIFIDEAETLLPNRKSRRRATYSYEDSQVASFLTAMDGVDECGAFVLLATNRMEELDQAVLRDGRCEFKVEIKMPDRAAIHEIIRRGLKRLPINGLDPALLARRAVQAMYEDDKVLGGPMKFHHILSGAMAASIPDRAARVAFARDKADNTITGITPNDMADAVEVLWNENKGLDHTYSVEQFMKGQENG